jgi:hypothetical protein
MPLFNNIYSGLLKFTFSSTDSPHGINWPKPAFHKNADQSSRYVYDVLSQYSEKRIKFYVRVSNICFINKTTRKTWLSKFRGNFIAMFASLFWKKIIRKIDCSFWRQWDGTYSKSLRILSGVCDIGTKNTYSFEIRHLQAFVRFRNAMFIWLEKSWLINRMTDHEWEWLPNDLIDYYRHFDDINSFPFVCCNYK